MQVVYKKKRAPMFKTDRAVNRVVTKEFLDKRVGIAKFGRSVWVRYCDFMLARGYKVELYEPKETVSKYVTVFGNFDLTYKVRFSTHPPSSRRMLESDVKMVVGYSLDGKTYTLNDAIEATLRWFDIEGYPNEGIRESDRSTCGAMGKEAAHQTKEEGERGAPRQMVLFT